jgi:hypothetical protein
VDYCKKDGTGWFWVAIDELARMTGLNRTTVMAHLDESYMIWFDRKKKGRKHYYRLKIPAERSATPTNSPAGVRERSDSHAKGSVSPPRMVVQNDPKQRNSETRNTAVQEGSDTSPVLARESLAPAARQAYESYLRRKEAVEQADP